MADICLIRSLDRGNVIALGTPQDCGATREFDAKPHGVVAQRYRLNALVSRLRETSATWELTMAYNLIPLSSYSKLASVTSSLRAGSGAMGAVRGQGP